MNSATVPSLKEFLAAPLEEVAKIAPATMVYGVGGTRRQAVFAGLEPWSNAYVRWAREQTLRSADLIFRHGVRNLVVVGFTPDNLREIDRDSAYFIEGAKWVIAGDDALSDYARLGWRVRLLGAESIPELKATADRLRAATPSQYTHTFYWNVVPNIDSPWHELLAAAQRTKATTREEVTQALYGEVIPPATLYLAFGKPMLSLAVIPPLLIGQIQGYWSQQPGYTLTETQLRTVFYDYAYLRPTWQEEKTSRAKEALAQRKAWEEGPLLGLGMRLGPFWYPAPMTSPAWRLDQRSDNAHQ